MSIALTLLTSVDGSGDFGDGHRAKLHAAIEHSLVAIDAGQTVPFADVIASLRAKRVPRSDR